MAPNWATEAVDGDFLSLLRSANRIQLAADSCGLGRPAPVAPTLDGLALSALYDALVTSDELREASRALFMHEHYSQAVEEGCKYLNQHVKDRSGLSALDGQDLMLQAFSEKKPTLRLNLLKTESDKNEQAGYMFLLAGCMRGIRNPRAHQYNVKDEATVALEMLVIVNHLLTAVDRASLAETASGARS